MTPSMSDLLDLALKAHGGLDRWREVKGLDARVSLTGALYHLKEYPEGVPNVTVRIDTPAGCHDQPIRPNNNFQVGGEQTFFFSEQGLLQRLDYLAVGPAAHYCFDHANYKGIVFPTLRRVLRRPPSGPLVTGPTPATHRTFNTRIFFWRMPDFFSTAEATI